MPCGAVAVEGALRGASMADAGGQQAGGATQGGMWYLILPGQHKLLASDPEAGLNPHQIPTHVALYYERFMVVRSVPILPIQENECTCGETVVRTLGGFYFSFSSVK